MLSIDQFYDILVRDGWIDNTVNKDSVRNLDDLSKEEIISYFQQQ
jgi:hypothetical protein